MAENKISVIVPVYNVEQYVGKCIESIIEQSYENLEIILVNDGSTDSSGNICDIYKKKDERIVVIHKKNGGLSSARNAGIDISTGQYIVFIDSDDYIDSNYIQFLYNDIKETNSDISICGYKEVYLDRTKNCNHVNDKIIVTGNNKFKNMYYDYSVLTVIAWNKLYKRSIFDNIRYMEGVHHEDEIMALNILKNADKISYNIEPLYNYVQRQGSITSKYSSKMFDTLIAYEERKKEFLKMKNQELIDINELFKFRILINILKEYKKCNDGSLNSERIKEMKIEIRNIIKKLLFSKNISLIRKIQMIYLRSSL